MHARIREVVVVYEASRMMTLLGRQGDIFGGAAEHKLHAFGIYSVRTTCEAGALARRDDGQRQDYPERW